MLRRFRSVNLPSVAFGRQGVCFFFLISFVCYFSVLAKREEAFKSEQVALTAVGVVVAVAVALPVAVATRTPLFVCVVCNSTFSCYFPVICWEGRCIIRTMEKRGREGGREAGSMIAVVVVMTTMMIRRGEGVCVKYKNYRLGPARPGFSPGGEREAGKLGGEGGGGGQNGRRRCCFAGLRALHHALCQPNVPIVDGLL